jgi:hypothetical protein
MRPRTFLIGFTVALLVVASGAAFVRAELSSLPSGELPENFDFRGREITAARRAMGPVLEAQLDGVERRSGFERVGPRGRLDTCEEGQDNFTRQDAHAYVCRIEIVQVLAVPKPFRKNASRLGEALLAGDCPDGTDTDRALAEPFHHVQDLDETSGDCTPGLYESEGVSLNGWLPAEPTQEQLERAKHDLPLTCYPWYARQFCEERILDLAKAVDAAPPDAAYLAIVTAGEFQNYYEVPWE